MLSSSDYRSSSDVAGSADAVASLPGDRAGVRVSR